MPKRTSAAESASVRVVIVTMDTHLSSAVERARRSLARELPGLELAVHAAAEWTHGEEPLARCRDDIARADIVVASMLFLEDHYLPVLPALRARRDACDAMVCCLSAREVTQLTRMGRFDMSRSSGGPLALLKRLRGDRGKGAGAGAGAAQMRMLRRLPRLLRFIPGTAQDVRAYFLTMQYWLGGSEANAANMLRFLIGRYADGARRPLRERMAAQAPFEYPDVGVYHPRLSGRLGVDAAALPATPGRGRVGLLLLRSYLLAENTAHYDGVIDALDAQGLDVVPVFATGLDARPAIDRYFVRDGRPLVDAIVSLTGFSLVGGPAYNDSASAEQTLAALDVPYVAAHPVEFQTLEAWGASGRGLLPVESTIMVAIPELDGATGPAVFGGRTDAAGGACTGCHRGCRFPASDQGRDMHACIDRAQMLAARVAKLVALRRSALAQRRVGIVLFNFPPSAGHAGTAAHLAVFESLHRVLEGMRERGYDVGVLPADAEALRERVLGGNAARHGTDANVHARVPVDDHVRRERWLAEIEAQWGPAPGRALSDGSSLFVLGMRFGNVFVGLQPGFGYEGDPMRLLFEKGFAPTHAFSAFYRWLREDFGAHALLHFGTHGALEFMPGKQSGLSGACWPDRLIADLPNLYLYAANNPSEGTLAKRRAAATLISYRTPSVSNAGLYRGLADLKATVERWRALPPEADDERRVLAPILQAQAVSLDLAQPQPPFGPQSHDRVDALRAALAELEDTLIPCGLHVVGATPPPDERRELLRSIVQARAVAPLPPAALDAIVDGDGEADVAARFATDDAARALLAELARTHRQLLADTELPAILHALDGGYLRPAPGGDLLRTPDVLPTGRNLHGFDPFRLPSAFAVADGERQAAELLARHRADGHGEPESVALVLWGTDNLKSEGAPIAQVLALLGARPRFDSYGRLAGAALVPLEELGHPRIDVMVTLSGIFRDLLPLQIRLLAEAAFLAASADEPLERNFVRKHALAYQAEHGCDLETAALRVYGNADGAYGSNVSHMVENGRWDDEDQLAETYARRKCFAFGRSGRAVKQPALLTSVLANVDLAYQNLDSVEIGVTDIDNYFDTLGGISRAVRRAKGGVAAPVYIGDQTRGGNTVRTLSEQVALETRTRVLNPRWYEGMLRHGFEGVRQIEAHVTNTMGWSATTGQVAPWVYRELTQTFVLDPEMRRRMAALNPSACAKVARRLLEAHERSYWQPDDHVLDALREAGDELEDRIEGVYVQAAA